MSTVIQLAADLEHLLKKIQCAGGEVRITQHGHYYREDCVTRCDKKWCVIEVWATQHDYENEEYPVYTINAAGDIKQESDWGKLDNPTGEKAKNMALAREKEQEDDRLLREEFNFEGD